MSPRLLPLVVSPDIVAGPRISRADDNPFFKLVDLFDPIAGLVAVLVALLLVLTTAAIWLTDCYLVV